MGADAWTDGALAVRGSAWPPCSVQHARPIHAHVWEGCRHAALRGVSRLARPVCTCCSCVVSPVPTATKEFTW